MASEVWQPLLERAMRQRPQYLQARSRLPHAWPPSYARPRLVRCSDGNQYVIKGQNIAGRSLVAEHVVARLGALIGAPVPDVAIIDLPREMTEPDGELRHIPPGFCHGCRFIPNCTNRLWVREAELAACRTDFAHLAVLYGWVVADDYQVFYSRVPPPAVYSFDHGHFFPFDGEPGAGAWTRQSLARVQEQPATPDERLVNDCSLTETELSAAVAQLHAVSNEAIANAVAAPPDAWLPSLDDRIALAEFLARRRDTMASAFTVAA